MATNQAIAISSTDLQRNYGEVLHRVTRHGLEFIITTHGREEMALVSAERYNELIEQEKKLALYRVEELIRKAS